MDFFFTGYSSRTPAVLVRPGSPCAGIQTEDYEIHSISYKHVIPMLIGRDLKVPCDNKNVKETGVWMSDWDYDYNNPERLDADYGCSADRLRFPVVRRFINYGLVVRPVNVPVTSVHKGHYYFLEVS